MAKEAKMQFQLASYAEVYCIICSLRRIVQAFSQMKPAGKCGTMKTKQRAWEIKSEEGKNGKFQ